MSKEATKAWKLRNREKVRAYQRAYYQENRELYLRYYRRYALRIKNGKGKKRRVAP